MAAAAASRTARCTATARSRFPVLVAVAEQLPEDLVLDGELVVWDTAAGRLSFEALQRRATPAAGAPMDSGRR
ncbi:hypothetical protein ACFWB2_30150 [Streptomyces virginiae]|uniref:hypothetical protein n=1 Tax=Streptomyces virginiae TaxID=1961 RepID=UPI0036B6CAC5